MKASEAKHLGNDLTRDKTLGIDTEIRFFSLEDGGDIEEGE